MANIPADHGTDRLLDVAFGHALGRIGRAAAAEDETALPPVACSCLPSDVSTKQPPRDPQILRRIAIRRVESDLCSNSRNLGAHILPANPQATGTHNREAITRLPSNRGTDRREPDHNQDDYVL